MPEGAEDGYDDVAGALEDATGPAGGAILQRSIREANGQPAYPAPTDYVAAIQATDGAVAIELDSDDTRVVRFEDPDDRRYLVGGDVTEREILAPIVVAMIDKHGAELVLYEGVAGAFEDEDADAQAIRPTFDSEVDA